MKMKTESILIVQLMEEIATHIPKKLIEISQKV